MYVSDYPISTKYYELQSTPRLDTHGVSAVEYFENQVSVAGLLIGLGGTLQYSSMYPEINAYCIMQMYAFSESLVIRVCLRALGRSETEEPAE